MSNKIQIKRSTSTATPTGLSNGELAFTSESTSNSLFIGAPDGSGDVYRIAGGKYPYLHQAGNPGVTTSNAVVITDANSFTTNTFTQGLTIIPSNGSGATGNNAFVNAISKFANATELGVYGTNASNNELVTSWAIKTYVDGKTAAASNPQGSNGQFQYNDSGVLAGTTNFTYNKDTGSVTVGNTSSHVHLGYISDLQATQENQGSINSYLQIAGQNSNTGASASMDVALYNDDGSYATFIDMGINSSGWSNAQWTINGANDGYLYTGGGNLAIGTNAASKQIKFFTGGTLSTNERLRITDSSITIANTVGITANGSIGTAGQLLASNGSALYWTSVAGVDQGAQYSWTNTQTFSNTITFNGSILANTINSVASNTTTSYASNSYNISTNFIANTTKITFTGANIDATSATLKVADAVVSGNLTINGTLTTVNTNNLVVRDNMIAVAANNSADSLDSGFYATYGTTNFAGLARDHADGLFKLFTTTTEPTTTVDFTNQGTLKAYLSTGKGFVANSSNVQITANSSVGVNIVANTLSLSTALPGTSGGTGKATMTNNAILVGNSTNGYNELTLGTTGYVLQSNGTALVYDVLDGGTF